MKFAAKEYVFVAVLVAIPLCAWWFIFNPRNTQIAQAEREIGAKQTNLIEMSQATAARKSLSDDISEYNEAIEFLQSKLPQRKNIETILAQVWRMAQANQLSVKSIRSINRSGPVTVVDPTGPYAEHPVAMEFEGDFSEGLYSFLLDLENSSRITRIHQLEINRLDKGAEGQVRIAMVMSIFFERGKERP